MTVSLLGGLVRRLVPGETSAAAVDAARALAGEGLCTTLEHLGPVARDLDHAAEAREEQLDLLARIAAAGLAGQAEATVQLAALGLGLPDGELLARSHARALCTAAAAAGTAITFRADGVDGDQALRVVASLRATFPTTGVVLPSALRRTGADVRRLADSGGRVTLAVGSPEPGGVSWPTRAQAETAYVRCLRTLMGAECRPVVATHDRRLIEIARYLAHQYGRRPGDHELQLPWGVRREEQLRLAAAGETVRVHVPYGLAWQEHVARVAGHPADLSFLVRSLLSTK